jgi:hypothetical protein
MAGCDSEKPEALTPITHEGTGMLSTLKNGQVWVAVCPDQLGIGLGPCAFCQYFPDSTPFFRILAERKKNTEKMENIEFILKKPMDKIRTGVYPVEDSSVAISYYTEDLFCNATSGKLTITYLDTVMNIISGQFDFKIFDSVSHNTIQFTEGRFDLLISRE